MRYEVSMRGNLYPVIVVLDLATFMALTGLSISFLKGSRCFCQWKSIPFFWIQWQTQHSWPGFVYAYAFCVKVSSKWNGSWFYSLLALQANNCYIFPGFGFGLVMSGTIRVHDDMLLAACKYNKVVIFCRFFFSWSLHIFSIRCHNISALLWGKQHV